MSTSRQPAPPSPTPSKSSLRRTSGVQNPSQRNLIPSPSPHFEDQATTEVRYSPRSPPNQTLDFNSDDDDTADEEDGPDPPVVPHAHGESYFPAAQFQDLVRTFQPLFTLIEDSGTSEHHHPSVHYIFADDDHEIIAEAAIRSLGEEDVGNAIDSSNVVSAESASRDGAAHSSTDVEQHRTSLLPSDTGVKDHFLILDVHPIAHPSQSQSPIRSLSQVPLLQTQSQTHSQPSAQQFAIEDPPSQQTSQHRPSTSLGVVSYTSLSPDWQIASASITAAPTMSDLPDSDEENLMLRIEGKGVPPLDSLDPEHGRPPRRAGSNAGLNPGADNSPGPRGSDKQREREKNSLEDMIERFQSQLAEIRKMIDVGIHQQHPQQGVSLVPSIDVRGTRDNYGAAVDVNYQSAEVGAFDEQD